jgi:hypothetical protein
MVFSALNLGAVAKLSEAKRRNSVGPLGFFLEKKLQLKKIFIFFFFEGIVILGIDKVHLALHEHNCT